MILSDFIQTHNALIMENKSQLEKPESFDDWNDADSIRVLTDDELFACNEYAKHIKQQGEDKQGEVLESKAKILAKHTGHHEDLLSAELLNEDCVTPKAAFAAMQEHGEQIAAEIKKWQENYPSSQNGDKEKAHLEGMYANNKEGWDKVEKYEKENARLREALQKITSQQVVKNPVAYEMFLIASEALPTK